MFDRYFSLPAALARHQSAPLATERERFLIHLEAGGTGRQTIRTAACYLLQFVHLLRLRRLRDVTPQEVEEAATCWKKLRNQGSEITAGQLGAQCFARFARSFLRFHGRLKSPRIHQPFSKYLDDFIEAMSSERGLSGETIRGRRYRAGDFLKWYGGRHRRFREVRLTDIDAYINGDSARSWNLVTRHSESSFLRAFFRHAESRRWCRVGIASAIHLPPLRRELSGPLGPAWRDVLRLLRATRGYKPNELRARPLLLLFAMYGLRRSEAANLLLNDIDWATNRFTVRRAKREGFPTIPIEQGSRRLDPALHRESPTVLSIS